MTTILKKKNRTLSKVAPKKGKHLIHWDGREDSSMNVYLMSHALGCVRGHGDMLWSTDLVLSCWGKGIIPVTGSHKCGAAGGCVRVPEGLTKLQRNWRRS